MARKFSEATPLLPFPGLFPPGPRSSDGPEPNPPTSISAVEAKRAQAASAVPHSGGLPRRFLGGPVAVNVLDASLRECSSSFGRHETFHPRFSWLTKGTWAVEQDPFVFTDDNAPAILGVGKNMVHAIRYWCQAFGLVEETLDHPTSPRLRSGKLTPIAKHIFGTTKRHGVDPYLEDPATLWLLHSLLIRRGSLAPSWVAALHLVKRTEFATEDLLSATTTYAEFLEGKKAASPSMLRRDVSCLLRMYGIAEGVSRGEDPTESPFADLRLIRRRSDGTLAWDETLKQGLPAALVAARAVEHLVHERSNAKTITIGRLLTEAWSPGVVFRLREAQLVEFLQRAAKRNPKIQVSEASSLTQLVVNGDPERIAAELRQAALERTSAEVRA